jgi:hypothetical protein
LTVTPAIFGPSDSANRSASASAYFPPKYPGCRGVTQDFAQSDSGQHGQPKYLSRRAVVIGKPTKELGLTMLGMCLECDIVPVEDYNVPSTDREAINVRLCPLADMALVSPMSAFGGKADIKIWRRHACFFIGGGETGYLSRRLQSEVNRRRVISRSRSSVIRCVYRKPYPR